MPKKTKKEKILAAYRKKLRLLEQTRPSETPSVLGNLKHEIKTKSINKNAFQAKKTELVPAPKFFFVDLKKSLILIVLIVALEIGLYFARLIK